MGATTSTASNPQRHSTTESDNAVNMLTAKQSLREHKRHGVVTVKINTINNNRRNSEGQVNHVITPRGAILYGSLFNPSVLQKGIQNSNFPILTPGELAVPDSRAHRLLVSYCDGWHVIPFPEVFSRHSGTCYVVGDRNSPGQPFQIKVGDCFRLGSVGLVVSEMKLDNDTEEQRIDAKTLQFLKDEALAFDTNEELALLASDEMGVELNTSLATRDEEDECGGFYSPEKTVHAGDDYNHRQCKSKKEEEETLHMHGGGLTNGEKYICYMCYETHNTSDDPLVAPCDCRGDTRFLHVQCLQKWYHSTAIGTQGAQVIRTTGNGAPACKICGAAYKTNFRRPDGRKASILELENDGPYLSLVVVTHHDTNPGLFNTKFRLNFGRRNNRNNVTEEEMNTIVIGRSSSCTMILDYRTVSTVHAKITYQNGKFLLSDNRSSNGTMVYIRDPLPLPYAMPMKIRMGRTTITLQAKRTWTAAMRAFFFGTTQADNANANNSTIKSRTSEGGNRASVASVDTSEEVGGSNLSPIDVQQFLATLNSLPGDKHDMDGSNMNNTALLNFRSYTIRTINDAGSVDGGENDDDMGSQRYDHYAYLSQQLAALVPPATLSAHHAFAANNNIGGGGFPLASTNTNSATNVGVAEELYEHHPAHPSMAKASPRVGADGCIIGDEFNMMADRQQYEEDEDLIKAEMASIAAANTNNYNNNGGTASNRSLSGSVSPAPVAISGNTLVGGSSASIVVMGNIEESHILQGNNGANSHGSDGKPSATELDGSKQAEEHKHMFNALPAAGVFAIPNTNSSGNLASSKM